MPPRRLVLLLPLLADTLDFVEPLLAIAEAAHRHLVVRIAPLNNDE